MTPKEQADFVKHLSANVLQSILLRIEFEHIPEHWNEVELRQYLADKFANPVVLTTNDYEERMRQYRNEVITKSL